MCFRLRTLLIVLTAVVALSGCGPDSKAGRVQKAAEQVDQHSKEIEDAAGGQSNQ